MNSYPIFEDNLFWVLLTHFVLVLFSFGFAFKYLIEDFVSIKIKTWFLIFLIFAIGLYCRSSEFWLGVHTDGFVSQESAHFWLVKGLYVKSCALGNIDNCKLYQQVLAPPGFPFLIVLYSLFSGFHSLNASVISSVLSSLTIILVFLITYLLFKRENLGLLAALIFALIPLNILESQSGASRPTGLFFLSLTIFVFLIAIDKKFNFKIWLLVALTSSYSIYVRQESYILVAFLIIFSILFKKRVLREFLIETKENYLKRKFFNNFSSKGLFNFIGVILIGVIFLVLQLPVLKWLIFNNPIGTYGAPGLYSMYYKNISLQILPIILHLFNITGFNHYNFMVSVLFCAGFLLLFFSKSLKSIFLISLFCIYLFLYASMSHINLFETGRHLAGSYIRRSIMYNLSYSIIAAYGFSFIYRKNKILFSIIFIISIITANFPFLKLSENKIIFKDARAKKLFTLKSEPCGNEYFFTVLNTPDNCLIITSKYMFVTNDYFKNNQRKVVDIELIHPDRKNLFLNYLKEFYFSGKKILFFKENFKDIKYYPVNFINQYFEKKFCFSVFQKYRDFSRKIIEVYELKLRY